MAAGSISNWLQGGTGRLGEHLSAEQNFENKKLTSAIEEICFSHYKNGGLRLHITLSDKGRNDKENFQAFARHCANNLPNISHKLSSCIECVEIFLDATEAKDVSTLALVLNEINKFEVIEPFATFVKMKQAIGLDLVQDEEFYVAEITTLYRQGKVQEALLLGKSCQAVGYENVPHALLEQCLAAKNWPNLLAILSFYKPDPVSIYELAHGLYLSEHDEVDVSDSREKLKIAMQLFDFCKNEADVPRLQAQIFYELSGEEMSGGMLTELLHLSTKDLCSIVDVLYEKNAIIKKLTQSASSVNLGLVGLNWEVKGSTAKNDLEATKLSNLSIG